MNKARVFVWLTLFWVMQAFAADAESVMFRSDAALTGASHGTSFAVLHGLEFIVETGGAIRSTPALSNGTLYFGSGDGNLYSVDAHDGAERWRFKTRGAISSSPALSSDTVFFTSRDSFLYAVTRDSGKERWRMRLATNIGQNNYWDFYTPSPILVEGILYLGGGDGHVYSIDAATGKTRWSTDLGARVRTAVAVSGDSVVLGTATGHVIALDRNSGRQRWKFATVGASHVFAEKENDTTSIGSPPSISDGVVAVGGRDGFIYGLQLATGKQLWRQTHDGSSWILSTAVADSTLYIGSGSASIVQAVELKTGTEKWRFKTHGAIFGSIVLADNVLYFADLSGLIYAIDRTTGTQQWRFATGSRIFAGLVLGDGILYAPTDKGILYALGGGGESSVRQPSHKVVFRQGKASPEAFSWFADGIDQTVESYLVSQGYEKLNGEKLADFMRQQIADKTPSVIVFADNVFPSTIVEESSANSLIRKYLDAGGKVVMLGPNPLAYHRDPKSGDVDKIDYEPARRVFGIEYFKPERLGGWYATVPTENGKRWGLRGIGTDIAAVDPRQVTTVLTVDELGNAGSWIKNYGGPEGSGLLQLNLPRSTPADFAPFQEAIEFGMN